MFYNFTRLSNGNFLHVKPVRIGPAFAKEVGGQTHGYNSDRHLPGEKYPQSDLRPSMPPIFRKKKIVVVAF